MIRITLLKITFAVLAVFATAAAESAQIKVTSSHLKFAGHDHVLDIYEDTSVSSAKKPAILLLPEYWGKDSLDEVQARQMAEKGYVVLVIDLYGESRHAKLSKAADVLQAEAEAKGLEHFMDLIEKSLAVLKSQPHVDASRVAGMGFGYGGGMFLNFAKKGNTGLKAVVIFYGGVKKLKFANQIAQLPALLYIRAEQDVYTSKAAFEAFQHDLAKTNFDLQILSLKDAHYGFINKGIESYGGDDGNTLMFYEPEAATAAWTKTFQFLQEKLK